MFHLSWDASRFCHILYPAKTFFNKDEPEYASSLILQESRVLQNRMRICLTVIVIFCAWHACAQVRGSIFDAAIPPVNPMNPNGDAFITSTGSAFSGPLDQTEFELPFIPLQMYESEPGADNQYAPGCEFYELVSDGAGAYPAYFYFSDPDGLPDNGDELLFFRFRTARFSNGSTAFSILVDTDYSFGFEGAEADPNAVAGNPGFEKEIALFNNTGADGGIRVYNVDGTAEPAIQDFYAPISSHYQLSYALNQNPACSSRVPVFVDMYVPFSALGISSTRQIRMAAAANENIASSLNGGASDIAGIDGNKFPDDDEQFITVINNYLPIRVDEPSNTAPLGLDATLALDENSADGTILHTISASDPNGDVLSFAIDRGNTDNAFTIDATTGTLSVNNSSALDRESNSSFSLVVRVSDGRLYDNVVLTINLNDVNDNAPVVPEAIVSLNENSLAGTLVHSVGAIDPDANPTLVYSITGGSGAAVFDMNSFSGVITVADPEVLDFESISSFTLTIQVSDGLFSTDAEIKINLVNVNEPPSLADGSVTIPENTKDGSVVYVLQGKDPDEGQILYYSIAGGNTGDAFTLDERTGVISVNSSLAVDFEKYPQFILSVIVTDGEFSDDALIVVNVTDLNEPPVIAGASVQIGPALQNGDLVHVAIAEEPDEGDVLVYSLTVAEEYPVFTIDAQTGGIIVTGLEELAPGITTHELIVTATDAGGLSGQGIIVVEIEKKNITPMKGFSPNGDEQNDFWRIDGIEGFPRNTVKIFNRWGNQIAEIAGYDNNEHVWTGEAKHVDARIESTYFFIISAAKHRPITGYVIVKP